MIQKRRLLPSHSRHKTKKIRNCAIHIIIKLFFWSFFSTQHAKQRIFLKTKCWRLTIFIVNAWLMGGMVRKKKCFADNTSSNEWKCPWRRNILNLIIMSCAKYKTSLKIFHETMIFFCYLIKFIGLPTAFWKNWVSNDLSTHILQILCSGLSIFLLLNIHF